VQAIFQRKVASGGSPATHKSKGSRGMVVNRSHWSPSAFGQRLYLYCTVTFICVCVLTAFVFCVFTAFKCPSCDSVFSSRGGLRKHPGLLHHLTWEVGRCKELCGKEAQDLVARLWSQGASALPWHPDLNLSLPSPSSHIFGTFFPTSISGTSCKKYVFPIGSTTLFFSFRFRSDFTPPPHFLLSRCRVWELLHFPPPTLHMTPLCTHWPHNHALNRPQYSTQVQGHVVPANTHLPRQRPEC